MKNIVLKPRVSEKAYALSQERNTFVFDVAKNDNKLTVKKAVEAQYGVTVTAVHIANIIGKAKRTYRRNGRFTSGKRTDFKKAYVTLQTGDSLPIFAALTEEQPVEEPKKEKK